MSSAFEFLRRNGAAFLALRVVDRALARATHSYFARVFLLAGSEAAASLPRGRECRWLSEQEIVAAQRLAIEIDDSSVAEAERGFSRCLGIFDAGRLAAYGWFTLHDVPASHCLGAAIELPAGVAYHYKGYTRPEYRGLGLYPALLAAGAERLAQEGIGHVLLAIERSNRASLRSCRRAGGLELGKLRVWGRDGKWGIASPAGAARWDIRFVAGAREISRQHPAGRTAESVASGRS